MSDGLIYSTRREFLCGTLGTLSLSATLPGFLVRTAQALARDPKPHDRVLVMLQLAGGNDGLNTVVPFAQDAYYRARPKLAIAARDCLKLNDELGLHPALAGLKGLIDDGLCAIVQGVGYPNPDRSHFKSMDIWHTGDAGGRAHSGWLGRYFDSCCAGQDLPDPNQAIALMSEAPLALQGDRFTPLAFRSAAELNWRSAGAPPAAAEVFEELNSGPPQQPAGAPTRNPALDFVRRAALQARMGAADVRGAVGDKDDRRAGRRGTLSDQLGAVLRMIAADFPTQVYYVSHGGFDTHANQQGRHTQLLRELGEALAGFFGQLRTHQLLDRVLVVSFSEFGRRVLQNASGGTDHGAAAPMFLMGAGAAPGIHGQHPSLEQLDRGDLVHNCDFRRVYAAVLRDWLGAQPHQVLRASFQPLPVIRRR